MLRLLVHAPCEVQKPVGWYDIVVSFGSSLRIDGATNIGELAQKVEGIDGQEQVALEETSGESGVPDEFVGVHRLLAVTTTTVHREVRG